MPNANCNVEILADAWTITIDNLDFPLQVSASAAIGGSGDVTAAATLTDNTLIKGDGGVKGVQTTGIIVDDNDNISGVPTIGMKTDYAVTGSEAQGTVLWNSDELSLEFVADSSGNITIGKELWDRMTNISGVEMTNGMVVSATAVSGNRRAITLTDATIEDSARRCIGVVTVPSIANNNAGRITKSGLVRGVDTNSFTEGDTLYANSANPGEWVNTEPSASTHYIEVGTVLVKSATVGVVDVDIRIRPSITQLSLTNGTALTTNGQTWMWDNDNGYGDFNFNLLTHNHASGAGATIPSSSVANSNMNEVTEDFADVAGVFTGTLDYANGPYQWIAVPVGVTSVLIEDIANPPAYPEAWAIMLYVYSNAVIDTLQADTSSAGNPTTLCTSGTLLDVLFEADLINAPYTIVSYWPHYEE